MEWLVMFLAIAVVVGAVVWLAGRARSARAAGVDDDEVADPERAAGPRHYDLAAGEGGEDPGDPGS